VLIAFNDDFVKVSGNLQVAVAGFFYANGLFSMQSSSLSSVGLTSNETLTNASLLVFTASSGSAFVGLDRGTPKQIGFTVDIADVAVALVKSSADARSWLRSAARSRTSPSRASRRSRSAPRT
jgi:hypothetical protein